MIETNYDDVIIYPNEGKWKASHTKGCLSGPSEIIYNKAPIIEDVHSYIGDIKDNMAIVRTFKDFHKQNASVLEYGGFLPYGSQIGFNHIYRYFENRLRVTSDVQIPPGASIPRHLGVGSLFLPGKWEKFYIIPAAQHQVDGAGPFARSIPKWEGKDIMIGHWHRPPIAMTFAKKNGVRVEIGTGSDIWRWESNLGFFPESGSYKLFLQENGIKVVREPLACCENFEPEPMEYRFTWYLAWDCTKEKEPKVPSNAFTLPLINGKDLDKDELKKSLAVAGDKATVLIDLKKFSWPESFYKSPSSIEYILEETTDEVSFAHKSVATAIKKILRQLFEMDQITGIAFKNFTPGISYNSSHVNKKDPDGVVHWDINQLLDFSAWTTFQAQEKGVQLYNIVEPAWNIPSMTGMFK